MLITEIAAALNSIKIATDLAKGISAASASFEQAETKAKLADLISEPAATKIKVVDIQQIIIEKNSEIRTLKEELKVKGSALYEPPLLLVGH